MEIDIKHNLDEVIRKWGRLPPEIDEACRQIVDDVVMSSEAYAKGLAATNLPGGGGNYAKMFFTGLARKIGNMWEGFLENVHQWAEAVERGGGPTLPSGRAFAIGGGRSPYMAARIFTRRKQPRGFYIFRDTRMWAIQQLQQFRHYLERAIARALR